MALVTTPTMWAWLKVWLIKLSVMGIRKHKGVSCHEGWKDCRPCAINLPSMRKSHAIALAEVTVQLTMLPVTNKLGKENSGCLLNKGSSIATLSDCR